MDSICIDGITYTIEEITASIEIANRLKKEARSSNEYRRRVYASRKKNHMCVNCGKEDAFTMAGRSMCSSCEERKNTQHKNRIDKEAAARRGRELREARRESGLCTKCGTPLPGENYKYVRCEKCRAWKRRENRKRRASAGNVGRFMRHEFGLCYICGEPTVDIVKQNGEQARVCGTCYERLGNNLTLANLSKNTMEARKNHIWRAYNKLVFMSQRGIE